MRIWRNKPDIGVSGGVLPILYLFLSSFYLSLIYPLTKRKTAMTKEKFFGSMGWAGMVTSILMYVFYFPQIENNLAGHKGTFIQPFMAGINCTLWVAYGFFKEKRDWPIVIANLPGIVFGYVAAFTAL